MLSSFAVLDVILTSAFVMFALLAVTSRRRVERRRAQRESLLVRTVQRLTRRALRRPDYARISALEIELGIVEPPPLTNATNAERARLDASARRLRSAAESLRSIRSERVADDELVLATRLAESTRLTFFQALDGIQRYRQRCGELVTLTIAFDELKRKQEHASDISHKSAVALRMFYGASVVCITSSTT